MYEALTPLKLLNECSYLLWWACSWSVRLTQWQDIISQIIFKDAYKTKNPISLISVALHVWNAWCFSFRFEVHFTVTVTKLSLTYSISRPIPLILFDGMCRMHFVPAWIINWLEPNYLMYNLKQACCCLPIWSSLVIMKSAVFIRGISLHHSQCRDMSGIKQASLSHLFSARLFRTKQRASHYLLLHTISGVSSIFDSRFCMLYLRCILCSFYLYQTLYK